MIKKIIACLLVLCISMLLFSCDGSKNEPTDTQTQEYILPTEIVKADITLPYISTDTFDPYTAKSSINRDLISVIYEGLYTPTQDGKGEPLLAESSQTDGKKITVKILSDVKFSDGTALTGNDVKNSFQKAKNSAYYKSNLSNIASVEITDNTTLVFNLYNVDAMALNVLTFPIVKTGGDACIGSGKYAVDSLDDIIYLNANTNHRDFSTITNKQIALYDMAGISTPIYPFKSNKISVYKQDLTDGNYINLSSQTVSECMNNLVYIGVNSKWAGSVTSLPWVRQVINIGINRTQITASSYLGQGTATVTPFKNEFYKLDYENLPDVGGETERAVAILERNGYTQVNSDGVRTGSNGELRLNILVCSENQYKVGVAEAVKKSLEELGFSVTVTEKKTAEEFTKALQDGKFGLYIGEVELTDNCDLSEFFTKKGSLTYGINEEFFENFSAYKTGTDSVMTFVESFSTEVPFVPLYYRKAIVSVNPNISGVGDNKCYSGIYNWKFNENK